MYLGYAWHHLEQQRRRREEEERQWASKQSEQRKRYSTFPVADPAKAEIVNLFRAGYIKKRFIG